MSESTPIAMADALRALPAPLPPGSGWPRLAASLARERRHRHRRRRWLLPAALAASLLLLLARPTDMPPPAEPPPAANPGDHDATSLVALQAESARLDAALASELASIEDIESAALRVQIADRVAWIDALLATAPEPDAGLALWSERVLLLRELHRLQEREGWLLAATTHASATPMVSL